MIVFINLYALILIFSRRFMARITSIINVKNPINHIAQ